MTERLDDSRHEDDNFRLSYSKVDRAEMCLRSYHKRYVERVKGEQHPSAGIGKAVHGVAEDLVREHVEQERRGQLDQARLIDLLRARWINEGAPGGEADFTEALAWLSAWIMVEGHVDHREVVGVEAAFSVELAPGLLVEGLIDRVDRIGNTAIVIDYKTNQRIYSQRDLETSLQLSIYALAARELYPWVEDVELRFYMMRHGVYQVASRTAERVEATRHYLRTVGELLQQLEEWPARPQPLCAWCDYVLDCPAHAVSEEAPITDELVAAMPAATLAEWARIYAEADAQERAAKSRRYGAQRALTALLKAGDGKAQNAAGWTFDLIDVFKEDQSPRKVCARIAERAGIDPLEVAELVCKVNTKAIEPALAKLELSDSDRLVLGAEVEAMGTFRPNSYFSAKRLRRP